MVIEIFTARKDCYTFEILVQFVVQICLTEHNDFSKTHGFASSFHWFIFTMVYYISFIEPCTISIQFPMNTVNNSSLFGKSRAR